MFGFYLDEKTFKINFLGYKRIYIPNFLSRLDSTKKFGSEATCWLGI